MLISSNHKQKLILIVNLESTAVNVSYAMLFPDCKPEIIMTYRETSRPSRVDDVAELISSILKTLSVTLISGHEHFTKLRTNLGLDHVHVSEVHFVLSSPWIVSKARKITLEYDKQTRIGHKLLLDAISTENDTDPAITKDNIQVVEQKIFNVKLNGYHVEKWENREATNVEISFALSVAGLGMIQRLRESCENILPSIRPVFHSSALLMYTGINAVHSNLDTELLLHIHGELTDIVILSHGECILIASSPIGMNSIVRNIAVGTDRNIESADSLISLHIGGHLMNSNEQAVSKIVNEQATKWATSIVSEIENAHIKIRTLRKIYVLSNRHEEFFRSSIGTIMKNKNTMNLSYEDFVDRIVLTPGADRSILCAIDLIAINSLKYPD